MAVPSAVPRIVSKGLAMPERIQLSRRKGWRKPENTVVVARPSMWGNPYHVGDLIADYSNGYDKDAPLGSTAPLLECDAALAVLLFRNYLTLAPRHSSQARWLILEIPRLRGKNLACWCPLDQPCHADVLLELANSTGDA
ncbi:MAG: hypothetical protein JWP32_2893 [Schumannella sp.]|nr:hypothetical protein [Schumannella sp.]